MHLLFLLLVGPLFGPGGGRCGPEALGLGLGLGVSLAPAYRFASVAPGLGLGLGLAKGRHFLYDQDGAGWGPGRPRPAAPGPDHFSGAKMWQWQFPMHGVGLGLARAGPYPIFPRPHLTTWKKKLSTDPSCCPVCGVTLRAGELDTHFVHELERLYKLSAGSRARRLALDARPGPSLAAGPGAAGGSGPGPGPAPGQRRDAAGAAAAAAADGTPEGRWDTYQRIKANRQGRLRIKNRKRKADEATCPVCNERVQGSVEELNGHVEMCLRKTGGAADEDENVDVEGDTEMFEEYEWAGQRRIRATTLLVGGFAAAGLATTSSRPSPVDEDVDLVVDGDDSATYGPPQYSEADVVVTSADGPRDARERDALREALISPDGSKREAQAASGGAAGSAGAAAAGGAGGAAGASSGDGDAKEEGAAGAGPSQQQQQPSQQAQAEAGAGGGGGSGGDGAAAASPADANPVLEALKSRIRELEGESRAGDDKFKCLICMERYKKPVISVCCWHVHCEECWLHTLVMLAGRPQPRGGERASAPGAVAVTLTIVLGGFLTFE